MCRPRFQVTITATLKRMIEVEANNLHEAEQIVSDGWHSYKYILGSEDFVGEKFEAVPAEGGEDKPPLEEI